MNINTDDELPRSKNSSKIKRRNRTLEYPLLHSIVPRIVNEHREKDNIRRSDSESNHSKYWNGLDNLAIKLIFPNDTTENISTQHIFWDGLYKTMTLLIFCIVFSSPLLLFPQQNSLLHPEYWYEAMLSSTLSGIVVLIFDALLALKYYFSAESMIKMEVFICLFVTTASSWILICCTVYWIWTVHLEFIFPVPLTLVFGYIHFIALYGTLYLLFLHNKNNIQNKDFIEKRILPFILSRSWAICIDLQYKALTFMFTIITSEWQWILAFLVPILREFNYFMLTQIMVKLPKAHDGNVKQIIICGLNTFHSLYVAIKLGQTTTLLTSAIILTIDFVINLHYCFQINRIHGAIVVPEYIIPEIRITEQVQHIAQKEYLIRKFLLTEILEVMVPVAYIVSLLIAYYGPNAVILGNIQNDNWQYEAIDDIGAVVQSVMIMCIIDGCSAIIGGYWVWKVSGIDCLREAHKVLRIYWICIPVGITQYLNYVSYNN